MNFVLVAVKAAADVRTGPRATLGVNVQQFITNCGTLTCSNLLLLMVLSENKHVSVTCTSGLRGGQSVPAQ